MDEYGLSHLIIAGSTIITGPLAGGMENFESICEKYSFDSVLDSFCGSGAYSKIAVEHGADTVEAVDIDTRAATPNLSGVGNATVHEMDMFDFTASRDYDLFIADPYYELSPKFIQEKLPQIGEHSDYLFMTVASNGHWYWKNKVTELLSDHVEIIDEHNTGRIIQVFAEL
jgi:16S rRNA G966 N2-methylase RsmD